MKRLLNNLFEHKTLDRSEAENVLTYIASGECSDSEIAAFITVFLMRSITVDELIGFRNSLLNLTKRIYIEDVDTIDVCGTGGDGKDTFNISTLTAFIIAGAGARVTKHGNYGVTSCCGSSNIMEYFGYRFSTCQDKLRHEIDRAGICFLHAPLFNQAMKNVIPVRKALKVKTFFNMLGPMVNPAFPSRQVIGVYSNSLARLYNYIYQQDTKPYSIVYSLDGYDEISLTSGIRYIHDSTDEIITPESLGYARVSPSELEGGRSISESAKLFMNVLKGHGTSAQMNVVIANAQIALQCYFPDYSAEHCKMLAGESIMSGKAFRAFANLMDMQV